MKKTFLIPVVTAISSLLGNQAYASLSPQAHSSDITSQDATTSITSPSFSTTSGKASSEFSVFDEGNEYLFLMQRSEAGVLTAYHSSHRSHSSHSSHRSHYSSR